MPFVDKIIHRLKKRDGNITDLKQVRNVYLAFRFNLKEYIVLEFIKNQSIIDAIRYICLTHIRIHVHIFAVQKVNTL